MIDFVGVLSCGEALTALVGVSTVAMPPFLLSLCWLALNERGGFTGALIGLGDLFTSVDDGDCLMSFLLILAAALTAPLFACLAFFLKLAFRGIDLGEFLTIIHSGFEGDSATLFSILIWMAADNAASSTAALASATAAGMIR